MVGPLWAALLKVTALSVAENLLKGPARLIAVDLLTSPWRGRRRDRKDRGGVVFLCSRFCGVVGMPQGTIKKLVSDKGFGFIETEGQKRDMFFHVSSLVDCEFDSLQIGQQVEYEVGAGPKGPRAENVRPVG